MAGEKDRRANFCHALWRPAHMPQNIFSHWWTQIFWIADWKNLIVMHWWTNFPANSSEAYGFKTLVMSRDPSSPMHGWGLFLTNWAFVLLMTSVWLLNSHLLWENLEFWNLVRESMIPYGIQPPTVSLPRPTGERWKRQRARWTQEFTFYVTVRTTR